MLIKKSATVQKILKERFSPLLNVQLNAGERHRCLFLVPTTMGQTDAGLRETFTAATVTARLVLISMDHVNKTITKAIACIIMCRKVTIYV